MQGRHQGRENCLVFPRLQARVCKTLAFGAAARVINQTTGGSATGGADDCGPYHGGRLVEVAPKVSVCLDRAGSETKPDRSQKV